MYSERINKEDRINARVNAMRAHRKSVQRKKNIPVIATAVCTIALLAGGTVFGISMLNNHKTTDKTQAVQSTVAAKNAQNTQKAAQVRNTAAKTNNQTANASNTDYAQDNMPTYDESTNSYSYSYTGYNDYDNNDYHYNNDDNYSRSDNSYSVNDNSSNNGSAVQTAYTGTHHSGASWNGTGSPLHFTENGKTTKGYDWRYEGGNGLVDLGCDYTFDGSSYDFSLIGKEPGSGSITVWHNTDNNTQVPTTINFTVDDDLNVTYN